MTHMDITIPQNIARPLWRAGLVVVLACGSIVAWAIYAPLATTIRLTGTIVSSSATVDIQHPYGGQVSDVFVTTHDSAEVGATLLQLDTRLEEDQRDTYQSMQRRLMLENKVISAVLTDRIETLSAQEQASGQHYLLRARQAAVQARLRRATAENLGVQIAAIDRKLTQNKAQISQLRARADRHEALLQRGIMARDNGEALQERIMIVSGDMAGEEAKRAGLIDQKDQQSEQAKLIDLSLREELTATRDRNTKQLNDLSLQIARATDVIEKSTVTAPIAGVITNVAFQAQGMYAARGQTLLSLSQPLQHPYLRFSIPTHQIDQIRPGMTGRFALLALNQRNMPRLDLTITAVSPRAQTDENNTPRVYVGRADIDPAAFAALRSALGEGITLSEDMPVELLIEGRKITVAQYIIEPLRAAFDRAIQD